MLDIYISCLIAIIWGTFPFVISSIMNDVHVHVTLLCLSFAAFVSAATYSIFRYGTTSIITEIYKMKYTTLFLVAVAAFFGFFLKNLLYFHVVNTTYRLNISISIMSLSSVISLLIGTFLYKYKLNLATKCGVVLTSIGVFIMLVMTPPDGLEKLS
jgi:drug/metabolite transporter (DMT)-like permease